MTIAAGVRCIDGIVICADTEHTSGDGKFEKPKVFGHDDWLMVTGAGYSDYMNMAFDKLYERFLDNKAKDQRDARQAVEDVVMDIYENNIGKIFAVGQPDSPYFHLIVGVRCLDGDLALIKTTYTSAVLTYGFEPVGVGANVFNYWAKFFFKKQRSIDVASYFCMFILQEVKTAVPGCGGGTVIAYMPANVNAPRWYSTYLRGGDPLAGFPQNAVEVLLDAVDLHDLSTSVAMFQTMAENLKGTIRHRFETAAMMRKAGDEKNRKSPVKASSSSVPELPPEQSGSVVPAKGSRRGRHRP